MLKVLAIGGVVFAHAARAPWDPNAVPFEIWLSRLCHVSVPMFLAVSGYLYATNARIPYAATRRRIGRILVPYLVATVAAQGWWVLAGEPRSPETIVFDVLLASSFGPFYYVFQIVTLVLLAPLIPHLPARFVVPLTVILIVAQLFVESLGLPLFWALRIPLFSGGSFMLGWTIRQQAPRIRAAVAARRWAVLGPLLGVLLAAAAGMSMGLPEWSDRLCDWTYNNVVIMTTFAATLGRSQRSRWLAELSDTTYTIYLFHLLFLYTALRMRPLAPGELDLSGMSLLWITGISGSLALVAVSRKLLGTRSRAIVGA